MNNESEVNLDASANDEDTVANLEVEVSLLSTPKRERYKKVEKILKKHMQDQTKKLETIWKEEQDSLDYAALKDLRFEFDEADEQIRNILDDFDRRKYSDVLSDHLLDMHDQLFQVYCEKYSKMADIKRNEAAIQRKKEKELFEYKNEKRRSIPTWPKSVNY